MIPKGWRNMSKRTLNSEDSQVSRNGVLDIKRGRGKKLEKRYFSLFSHTTPLKKSSQEENPENF